jgi:hypothetical protein
MVTIGTVLCESRGSLPKADLVRYTSVHLEHLRGAPPPTILTCGQVMFVVEADFYWSISTQFASLSCVHVFPFGQYSNFRIG